MKSTQPPEKVFIRGDIVVKYEYWTREHGKIKRVFTIVRDDSCFKLFWESQGLERKGILGDVTGTLEPSVRSRCSKLFLMRYASDANIHYALESENDIQIIHE